MAKKIIKENQIEMFEPKLNGYGYRSNEPQNNELHPPAIIPDRIHNVLKIVEPVEPTATAIEPQSFFNKSTGESAAVIEPVTIEPPTATAKESAKKGKLNMDDATDTGFTFIDGDDMALTAKAPVYLIKGILEQDSHGVMFGASMSYKTFVALSMAHSICTGKPFMGRKVRKTGVVLYVCGEGDGAMKRRIKAQVIKKGGFNGNFKMLEGNISIDSADDMARLEQTIRKIKPVLVIFDTFASLVGNTNENDNGAVGAVLKLIKETCRTDFGTSSMIVHHTGKDDSKGMRGASAFKNNVDFSIELKRANDFCTTMSCEKMKDGENFKDIHMVATVVELGIKNDDEDDLDPITSVVMMQVDNVKTKDNKSLNSEERKVLDVLTNLLNSDDAMTPSKSVIDLFPNSPQNAPKKVITVRTWLENSNEVITVSSEPEKEKQAKRVKFDRVRKKLHDSNCIGVHGDVVWIVTMPQPA